MDDSLIAPLIYPPQLPPMSARGPPLRRSFNWPGLSITKCFIRLRGSPFPLGFQLEVNGIGIGFFLSPSTKYPSWPVAALGFFLRVFRVHCFSRVSCASIFFSSASVGGWKKGAVQINHFPSPRHHKGPRTKPPSTPWTKALSLSDRDLLRQASLAACAAWITCDLLQIFLTAVAAPPLLSSLPPLVFPVHGGFCSFFFSFVVRHQNPLVFVFFYLYSAVLLCTYGPSLLFRLLRFSEISGPCERELCRTKRRYVSGFAL